MAFIQTDIALPEAERTLPVQLYFPTDLPESVGNRVNGVIWLLHGMGNTASHWMQYSAAPRYAADNGYILIAPSASNSFYNDMAAGAPFYTMLTTLLPAQLGRIFQIPQDPAKTFICGLSMGGYGALRISLANPGRFAAAGSFSGAVDIAGLAAGVGSLPVYGPMLAGILGPGGAVPDEANLHRLIETARPGRPRLFLTCGRQDTGGFDILAQNHDLCRRMDAVNLPYTYKEWDGVHEWNFWDRSLAEFISFIQGSDYAARKEKDWCTP